MTQCRNIILFCVCCLLAFGTAIHAFNTGFPVNDNHDFSCEVRSEILWRLVWLTVGILLMLWVARLDYHKWRVWCVTLLLTVWLTLVLTLFQNPLSLYVDRIEWLGYGQIAICPSQWSLLALAVFLASVFALYRPEYDKPEMKDKDFRLILLFCIVLVPVYALVVTCVLVQGHGTSFSIRLLLFLITFCMAVCARTTKTIWALVVLGGTTFIACVLKNPVRFHRFLQDASSGFDGPHCLPTSLLAIKAGGWFGVGLGQSQLCRNIANPTEMSELMTAFIGEELGMVTILTVASLLLALIAAGIYLYLHAYDRFGSLLAGGLVALLGGQSLIHFAVAFGWISMHGLALPFVSETGSNVCIPLICAGLLLSIARNNGKVILSDQAASVPSHREFSADTAG